MPLAAAIRKPDPRKRASFGLRFADAKSALAALKAEAARRKLRGFEATIDPRLNSIAMTAADDDTLEALREILGRLDMPVGEPKPKPESGALSKLAEVWIAEKVTSFDEVVPKEKYPFELHFENDKLIYRFVPPGTGKNRVHEIVVTETKHPATIDMTREIRGKKETVYSIFKLEAIDC